jgi:anaerobic ribonucleoside-triphosphate reductase activating protein
MGIKGKIVYPSYNSSLGIAYEIYLSGCNRNPKCVDCYNPLLWDKDYGDVLNVSEIKIPWYCDCIVILGGEPLHSLGLYDFIFQLKQNCTNKIYYLYTSYELYEIEEKVKQMFDYIKTGKYENNLKSEGFFASSNQKLFKNENGIWREVLV